jgi:hypothetical protein
MKTIRRLYFYAVALISLEVVLWGLIGLLRSIVGQVINDSAQALAQALSLILVGVPIFLTKRKRPPACAPFSFISR